MDDLISFLRVLVIFIVGSQLFFFLIDLIAWAVRKKHPARIEKSENVSYPQYITVSVWHDSHRSHGYKEITYIRKEDNKYKRYIKRSVGGWIGIILLDILLLLIIFWYPIFVFLFVPNYPDPELPIGYSVVVSLLFLHKHFIGIDTIARIELNKYLKAQSK